MSLPILQPQTRHAQPPHPLPGGIGVGLMRGRVHEICGPSRVAFTLMTLALSLGPVVWVSPAWLPERLYSCGIRDFLHPGRLVLVQCRRVEDIQWAAEEALRAGTAPLVVADYPTPPTLTPVRRLHLAAESPAQSGHPAPLGLLLTPAEGGAQGVESRWQASPHPAPSGLTDNAGVAFRITLRRARNAPPAEWHLIRSASGDIRASSLARSSLPGSPLPSPHPA